MKPIIDLFTGYYWLLALALFVILAVYIWREVLKEAVYRIGPAPIPDDRQPTSYDDAKAALDRMKDWAVWLVGIQTGAMSLIGFATKSDLSEPQRALHLFFGILAVAFLGVSTYCFGWLLAAFPSVQQRLEHTPPGCRTENNDIYALPLFTGHKYNVQAAAGCSHFLGIAGFACFAVFFIVGLSGVKKSEPPAIIVQGLDKPLEIRLVPPTPTASSQPTTAPQSVTETLVAKPRSAVKDSPTTPKSAAADKPNQ